MIQFPPPTKKTPTTFSAGELWVLNLRNSAVCGAHVGHVSSDSKGWNYEIPIDGAKVWLEEQAQFKGQNKNVNVMCGA